jgi:hypothetical protein
MGQIKKLCILYRACNKELVKSEFNQSRPPWFSKFKCWDSFFWSFGNRPDIDIFVLFDGKKEDELARHILLSQIKDIEFIPNIGNKESLIRCYNFLEMYNYMFDYVFFAEDDYLYRPDSDKILIEGLESFGSQGHFITLYDHLNRYLPPNITGDVTTGQDYCLLTKSSHWRTGDSTTGSVAMTKELFNKVKERLIFHNVHDCAFYREMLGLGHRVFNCIPGRSTHVNQVYASPLIDWEYHSNIV